MTAGIRNDWLSDRVFHRAQMITEHIADSLVCLSEFVGGWHPGMLIHKEISEKVLHQDLIHVMIGIKKTRANKIKKTNKKET